MRMMSGKKGAIGALGLNVALLGAVSFITDVSSEMIMPALPLFIASLGGGGLAIGLIGGLGDGIASILRLTAGYASDRLGRRKILVALGYLTSSISKMGLTLVGSWQHVLGLRVAEKAGKGIRTPPRDALIAESAIESWRGRAFGLHRALDTAGAVIGSIVAFVLLSLVNMDFRSFFLMAGVIAFMALIPLYFVKETVHYVTTRGFILSLRNLPKRFKLLLPITTLFAAGNLSYMFPLLRVSLLFEGWASTAAPLLLYVFFNVVYAVFSYPMGTLADRVGKSRVLAVGYAMFAFTFSLFIYASVSWWMVMLFALYGLAYASVEGVERALVADVCGELKGTGLGIYHALTGLTIIVGNLIAGALWELVSPSYAFMFAASLSTVAMLLLALWSLQASRG